MPREVIVKTFCDGSETLDKKAVQRTYREISAWVALSHSAKLCENINRFCGVLAADFDLIEDLTPGVPSIVTDFVRFESIEYTQGKDFGVRLNIDNFRVTEDGIVKIIDLGLSRYQTTTRTGFTTAILPCYRFIAPELIQQNIGAVRMLVTKTTDVYAFSMTALQGKSSFAWRHWGCTTPKIISNLKSQHPEPSELDGYEDLRPEDQAKIVKAWQDGHVDPEDIPPTAIPNRANGAAEEIAKRKAPAKKKATAHDETPDEVPSPLLRNHQTMRTMQLRNNRSRVSWTVQCIVDTDELSEVLRLKKVQNGDNGAAGIMRQTNNGQERNAHAYILGQYNGLNQSLA
ncbi:hypothetical protein EST38_g8557 [Candolleomyces aberdarensis]|uniref:PARP-type domain-containing protein n=1 Tax=Candolleomyces aberdarensis TaxID=2316362 RepID=A0A4Q2DE05_9AGAR|nr:hypothetical protein EST38_g8557 [Candolleomyces aberdarensis]